MRRRPEFGLPVLAAVLTLVLVLRAASAEDVNTGAQCVRSLHEETTNAGPLPSRLTSLLSSRGQQLLTGCRACANYPEIAAAFTTQVTQAFCGVASSITILNASPVPKPLTDPYKPYPYFTQCNIFNAKAREKLNLGEISKEGMTLAQTTYLLNAQAGVRATCWHAGPATGSPAPSNVPDCKIATSAAQFRQAARKALDHPRRYVIINFSRATLSDVDKGGGHFSPLAAYNGKADDLLVMDVARYKYPPFWVDADLLWSAMATTDTSSNQHRGYVVIQVEPAS